MIFLQTKIFQVSDSEINFFEVYDSVKEVFCAVFEFKIISKWIGNERCLRAEKNVGVFLKQ
jgi:hypothetical protein